MNIVRKALKIPTHQIATNAGVDASEVVNRIMGEKEGVGYDALNDEFVDMIAAGILDPTKVSNNPLSSYDFCNILYDTQAHTRGANNHWVCMVTTIT